MIKRWTKEETTILKQNMDSALSKLKKLLPDRTEDQILEKVKLLYRANPTNKWTDVELSIMEKNIHKSIFDLMKLLPNRSIEAIRYKKNITRGVLGIAQERKDWTPEELKTLKDMKDEGHTNYEISEVLNRPLNSVIGKLSTGNMVERRLNYKSWTKEDEEKIHKCIQSNTVIDTLVPILNRDVKKIYNKCLHLGYIPIQIPTKNKQHSKNVKIVKQTYEKQLKLVKNEVKILNKDIKNKDKTIVKLDKKVAKLLNVIHKA